MALELNTDISKELNIKARRGDTFEVKLEVIDPSNSGLSYALHEIQYRARIA